MGVAGGETQLQDRMPPKSKRGRPKGGEKKQRKKKDPNAPKRPMSAYFLFMNAQRPQVRKENPDASIGEVAKIMGKLWGEIEPADKAKYDKDAAAATRKTRKWRRTRTANRKVEPCGKKEKRAQLRIHPRGGVAQAAWNPFYRGRILIQALWDFYLFLENLKNYQAQFFYV